MARGLGMAGMGMRMMAPPQGQPGQAPGPPQRPQQPQQRGQNPYG